MAKIRLIVKVVKGGFVVRECFHAGVPVIASNVGGIPEVVKNSENGLLFEPGDFIDLAAKLVNVITKPEMIDSFRKNIKPVRTISEDAKELGRLYSSIIGSKKIN
jgi:glycosyltransferase involved in cell wall biosynthesis